jgi:RHS repeat-associated protein
MRIERWHFEPDGVRPPAREAVVADGRDVADATLNSEWLVVVADQIGTPTALFDNGGAQRWTCDATLSGRARTVRDLLRARSEDEPASGDQSSCALRFPGQWEDAESGLHYNLKRYYDPDTGQYLSPDPIGLKGGTRTHAYVHNPMAWIDWNGLAACASAGDTVIRSPDRQILSVKGTIKPSDIGTGTPTNASSRTWARPLGSSADDAGHTRGSLLGGSGGKDYVWPQDPHYNRGQFRDFEGRVASYVKRTNQPVNFEQTYQYANGGTRPTGVDYVITDIQGSPIFSTNFPNP